MRWLSPRVLFQAPLGLGAGLPYLLTGSTLVTWMTASGVDIKQVSLFMLIALPGNLKFLWAPFLDRFTLPFLGPRRGWLVVCQIAVALAVFLLGQCDPHAPLGIAGVALIVAFLAATQNILVDAYRADVLEPDEVGQGSSSYVIGFRAGMIIAGSVALALSDYVSWRTVYTVMAGLSLLCVPVTLLAPKNTRAVAPRSLSDAVWKPLGEFFSRKHAWWALVFLMVYKFGDGLAIGLINSFLTETGFTGTEIGTTQQGIGLACTIVGALIGGPMLDRIGLIRALIVFGFFQAAANSGYVYLALKAPTYTALVVATVIDSLCTGLATAAFVGCVTALCDQRFSATQYALFTAATSLLAHTLGAGAGWLIAETNWAFFFACTGLVTLPVLPLAQRLPFPHPK